jgi:hypothetical protein
MFVFTLFGFAIVAGAVAGALSLQGRSMAGGGGICDVSFRRSARGTLPRIIRTGRRLTHGHAHYLGGGTVSFALEWIVYRSDFELRLHRPGRNSQASLTARFAGLAGMRLVMVSRGERRNIAEVPEDPGGRERLPGRLLCG